MRHTRATATVLPAGALFLAAAVAAGCGGGEPTESAKRFGGEKQKVAQVVEDFEAASHDGDVNRICDELIAKRDKPMDCERDVEAFVGQVFTKKADLVVRGVELDGSRATARVEIKGREKREDTTYPLVKDGSTWRLSASQE